jgi:cell division protein FtsQ
MAAGLEKPLNLLAIDASASMAALGSLPWVESAELVRYFPDGVSVTVKEYDPRAIAALDNLYLIDEKGRPFKRLDPGENPPLPIVSGFAADDLLSGGPLVLDGVGEVLRLMELLAGRTDEFRLANVSEIHYDPDRGVTFFTRDGELEVKVGRGAFAEKLIRLGRVAAHLKLGGRLGDFGHLNLDSPPRVTGRLRKGLGRAAKEPAGDRGPA